jgi:hypothetical protein
MAQAQYDDNFWNPQATPAAPQAQQPMTDWSKLTDFRKAASGARYLEDQSDDRLMADPRYAHFFNTGEYRPSGQAYPDNEIGQPNFGQSREQTPQTPQTPTQQWNQPNPSRDALFQQLMARATQGTAVNSNDPNIRQQVDPYVAQQERAKRNYLGDVAEKAGPYGNIAGETRMANERFGQQAGLFEGEIIGREIQAKRDEIEQALSLWGSLMSNEQQLALQQQLAELNDRSRTADRSQQNDQFMRSQSQANDQFMRELALREYDTNQGWDYKWAGF